MPSPGPCSATTAKWSQPAERYLAYLAAIERSPNTVGAYAVSLKLWFEFLAWAKVGWEEVGIEDVARFVAWLRAPAPNVVVLADAPRVRRPATVNRYLAGVFGFYDHTTGPASGWPPSWWPGGESAAVRTNRSCTM